MSTETWRPSTMAGDVVLHHAEPDVWIVASVRHSGDPVGRMRMLPKRSRDDALAAARIVLAPGHRIYIHHHDAAEWECLS